MSELIVFTFSTGFVVYFLGFLGGLVLLGLLFSVAYWVGRLTGLGK